ncbi:hypothetical protein [Embleya sp. NPDC059237]|uniref:hypothetical protein n=1 Tax=Embleya sp. NPDC059237 TaxID=3346784 RepID=UPI0036810680
MTTLRLSVDLDGVSVPLHECDWVLRQPCGCVASMMHAVTSLMALTSEDEAWHEFYCEIPRADKRRRAIAAAREQGHTIALMTIDDAVRAWEVRCTHGQIPEPAQQAPMFDPTDPAGISSDVNA